MISYIFYMGVFQFVIKKKEKGPETDFLFLKMILTFFKSILILIITSPAIDYSQNVFRGFSILVYIGVQVIFVAFYLYFLLLLSRVTRSCARLAFTSV